MIKEEQPKHTAFCTKKEKKNQLEYLSAQTKQRQVKKYTLSLGMHRKVKSQLSQWKETSATASSFRTPLCLSSHLPPLGLHRRSQQNHNISRICTQ